ncbi:MAG TPA: hypothetical protein VM051_10695 [Usitatibacter sp.]|nr:hypothetical protein [Usitatibacter sp.]
MSGRPPIVIDRRTTLELTAEGERCLASRGNEVSAKLRGVLTLFRGVVTLGEVLDQAGSTRTWMENCIIELLEAALIRVVSPSQQAANGAVARAKIELLRQLQSSGSFEATLLADELLHARTLRELAELSRDIAKRLRESDGDAVAEPFWNEAKRILVRWRDGGDAARG